ncbi:MAG: hypothetical protein AAFO95_05430 [Cyanobacteria bacterium J06600_6]
MSHLEALLIWIKEVESGTDIREFIEQQELEERRRTINQIVGAIRLAGYDVKQKVTTERITRKQRSKTVIIKD